MSPLGPDGDANHLYSTTTYMDLGFHFLRPLLFASLLTAGQRVFHSAMQNLHYILKLILISSLSIGVRSAPYGAKDIGISVNPCSSSSGSVCKPLLFWLSFSVVLMSFHRKFPLLIPFIKEAFQAISFRLTDEGLKEPSGSLLM